MQDRTIYEDSIFAKMLAKTGLMDERDYKTYVSLFRNMSNFMCKPSVIVLHRRCRRLSCKPKTVLRHGWI